MIRSSIRVSTLFTLIVMLSVSFFSAFDDHAIFAQTADVVEQSVEDVDTASAPDAEEIRGLILFATPQLIADGQTVVFVGNVSNGNDITWRWNFGDGSPEIVEPGSGKSIRREYTFNLSNPSVAEDFDVSLTASNPNNPGGVKVTTTIKVSIQAPTGLTVNHQANFGTANQLYTFAANVQNESGVTYYWDFGDGTIIENGPAVVTHAYSRQGAYLLVVRAINTGGVEVYSQPITIWSELITRCSYTVQGSTVIRDPETGNEVRTAEIGKELTFTPDSDGSEVDYIWNFGDGTENVRINSKTAVRHTYTEIDLVEVELTCKNTSSTRSVKEGLNIVEPPPVAIAGLSLMRTASAQSPQESNQFVSFSANTGNATNVSYAWSFGDGSTLVTEEETVDHKYTAEGSYVVTVVASNSISSKTTIIAVHIVAPEPPSAQSIRLQYRPAIPNFRSYPVVGDDVLLTIDSIAPDLDNVILNHENTLIEWDVSGTVKSAGARSAAAIPEAGETRIIVVYEKPGRYAERVVVYHTVEGVKFVYAVAENIVQIGNEQRMPFIAR